MIAYIDESGDKEKFCILYFITNDEKGLNDVINKTRLYLKKLKIPNHARNKLLNELKEHKLANKYENILKKFIKMLETKDFKIYFFYVDLKPYGKDLNQNEKKYFYLKTLEKIKNLNNDEITTINEMIFDNFDTKKFQENFINIGTKFKFSIYFEDSSNKKGLQVADLCVGRIRRSFLRPSLKKSLSKILTKSEIIKLQI